MKKNIVIIYGSDSTEHDISILTALQVFNAIDKQKYNVDLIYIARNGKWFLGQKLSNISTYKNFNTKNLKEVVIMPNSNFLHIKHFKSFKSYKKIDCVILSLHGKNGEDGTIQGLLELAKIPYTSSCVLGSSVGLDKSVMKQIFELNKIPITKHTTLLKTDYEDNNFDIKRLVNKIKFPVVVKPNCLGSSIGISLASNEDELIDALNLAFMFDEKVLLEKYVENLLEVNIAVLGDGKDNIVSSTEEVLNKNGLLSFEKKYLGEKSVKNENINKTDDYKTIKSSGKLQICAKNGMQNLSRIIPANISKQQDNLIKKYAKKIFEITNSKGVVRIDFMIDKKSGKVYANEINTIPGSLAFYLWQKQKIDFTLLIDKLIEIAVNSFKNKKNLLSTFNSSVLK